VRVVVALGGIAWQAYLRARRALGLPLPRPLPRFAHGATVTFADGVTLIATYHPSQQNTFTGKLTRPMLDRVFRTARALLDGAGRRRTPAKGARYVQMFSGLPSPRGRRASGDARRR
jgi:uracil-DNA glycosylase